MTQKEEYLPFAPTEGFPAWINVTAGFTKSLGKFDFAKVSISITYPCEPAKVDEAYPKLKNWVDGRVEQEYKEISEAIEANKVEI